MIINWLKKLTAKNVDSELEIKSGNVECKVENDNGKTDDSLSPDYRNPFAIRECCEELIDGNRKKYYHYFGLGTEQRRYSICLPMCNYNSYSVNNKEYDLSVNGFEKNIKCIFEEKFIPKIKKMTLKDITFNNMFKEKEKLPLNENQIIYFIYYFGKFINLLSINSVVSSKNISIYINLKNNKYCILKDSTKMIEVSYDNNILKEFYSLIEKEIIVYNSLNEKGKIQRILNKYDIRCDFTKRKYSYQINSRHLVLTESMDKTEFLKILETKDSETIKTILHNFILVVLNKRKIYELLPDNVSYKIKKPKSYKEKNYLYVSEKEKYKTRLYCIEIGSGFTTLFRNVDKFMIDDKIYLTDVNIKKFIELMKPAPPRYLINKIQELDYMHISRKEDDVYIFNIDLARADLDYDILLYIIVNGFEVSKECVDIDGNYYFPMVHKIKGEIKYNYKYQHIM